MAASFRRYGYRPITTRACLKAYVENRMGRYARRPLYIGEAIHIITATLPDADVVNGDLEPVADDFLAKVDNYVGTATTIAVERVDINQWDDVTVVLGKLHV